MRQTEYWRALLGVMILLLVLVFPQGIVGASRQWRKAEASHERALDPRAAQIVRRRPRRRRRQLHVEQGEFLALIGPNGAGNSTCFNMINGQLAPDGGDILAKAGASPGCRRARSGGSASAAPSRSPPPSAR